MALGSFFYDNALAAWIFDKSTLQFIEVNSRSLTLYGYTEAEFKHKLTVSDLIPADDRKVVSQYLKSATDLNATLIPQMRKDGTTFQALVYLKSVEFYGRDCAFITVIDNTEIQVSAPLKVISTEDQNFPRATLVVRRYSQIGK